MDPLTAKCVSISYDEACRCVVLAWKSYANSPQLRDAQNLALNLLIEKRAERWLADVRKLTVVSLEDEKWIRDDWLPRARRAGRKYSAVVVPSDSPLISLSMQPIQADLEHSGVVTRNFTTVEAARAWFQSM